MKHSGLWLLTLTALLTLAGAPSPAHPKAHWSIGLHFGSPGGYYRPRYHCHDYYSPWPRPVYVVPAPVYVPPQRTIIERVYTPPAVQPAPNNPGIPNDTPLPPPRRLDAISTDTVQYYLSTLADPDEQTRLDNVMQLGRMKSLRAVDPLAATLAGDSSPAVRETAAKALGLIGSPTALPALKRAVQVDQSHDVRRTAQFAIEIIQSK